MGPKTPWAARRLVLPNHGSSGGWTPCWEIFCNSAELFEEKALNLFISSWLIQTYSRRFWSGEIDLMKQPLLSGLLIDDQVDPISTFEDVEMTSLEVLMLG